MDTDVLNKINKQKKYFVRQITGTVGKSNQPDYSSVFTSTAKTSKSFTGF